MSGLCLAFFSEPLPFRGKHCWLASSWKSWLILGLRHDGFGPKKLVGFRRGYQLVINEWHTLAAVTLLLESVRLKHSFLVETLWLAQYRLIYAMPASNKHDRSEGQYRSWRLTRSPSGKVEVRKQENASVPPDVWLHFRSYESNIHVTRRSKDVDR